MQQELPSVARGPATTMLSPEASRSGRTPLFFSSVIDSRAAWLASAAYDGWWNRYGPFTGSPYGFSKRPSVNFNRSTRRAASLIRAAGTFPTKVAMEKPAAPGSAPPITSEPALAALIQAPEGSQSVVMSPV